MANSKLTSDDVVRAAVKDDPLDKAIRIDEIEDNSGLVKKTEARIRRDDLDENRTMEDEVENGLRIADDEFEDVSVGLLGADIDPDLVQFDEDGNLIKKKAKKKKKAKDPNDPFAEDEDEDEDLDEEDEEL